MHNIRKIFAQSVDFLPLGKIIGLSYFVLLKCPEVEGDTGYKKIWKAVNLDKLSPPSWNICCYYVKSVKYKLIKKVFLVKNECHLFRRLCQNLFTIFWSAGAFWCWGHLHDSHKKCFHWWRRSGGRDEVSDQMKCLTNLMPAQVGLKKNVKTPLLD